MVGAVGVGMDASITDFLRIGGDLVGELDPAASTAARPRISTAVAVAFADAVAVASRRRGPGLAGPLAGILVRPVARVGPGHPAPPDMGVLAAMAGDRWINPDELIERTTGGTDAAGRTMLVRVADAMGCDGGDGGASAWIERVDGDGVPARAETDRPRGEAAGGPTIEVMGRAVVLAGPGWSWRYVNDAWAPMDGAWGRRPWSRRVTNPILDVPSAALRAVMVRGCRARTLAWLAAEGPADLLARAVAAWG